MKVSEIFESADVKVRSWKAQVGAKFGKDVKYFNDKHGGGTVDRVVASLNNKTVAVYNRKIGQGTIFSEGVVDNIKKIWKAAKNLFKATPIYQMPSGWEITFDETNAKYKNNLDPTTWQIAFMAGDVSPEISSADSFQEAYYGGQLPFAVEEKTWHLAHAAGAKHSKS